MRNTKVLILLILISVYLVNPLIAQIPVQPATGVKDFLWIRVEFSGGRDIPSDNREDIDATMSALDEYIKIHSNGKASVGEYEVTPVFKSELSNEKNLKNNLFTIRTEMIDLARKNGIDVNKKFIYLEFTALNLTLGGGAFGSGNGDSGTGWLPNPGDIFIPGVIHETFHMFGLGHAENTFGETVVYPGVSTKGGHDPYFFMGSEGDASTGATIPLAMKKRIGWLDPANILEVSNTARVRKRIFASDVDGYPRTKLLGISLNNYSDSSLFIVSYVQNSFNRSIATNGVLVHEVRKVSPAVTRILDLRPDSKEGNTFRPNNPIHDFLFEFGDGALRKNEEAVVGDLFRIRVIDEGGIGKNKWADVEITPGVALPACVNRSPLTQDLIAYEGFDYEDSTDIRARFGCHGWKNNWVVTNGAGEFDLDTGSITYDGITSYGKSLRVRPTGTTPTKISRNLESGLGDGEYWVSFLMNTNKPSTSHAFVMPNQVVGAAVGTNSNGFFAIGNVAGTKSIKENETALVVVKYVLREGNDDVYLWVNPSLDQVPMNDSADVSIKGSVDIGNIRKLGVNVQEQVDSTLEYTFDELRVSNSYNVNVEGAIVLNSDDGFADKAEISAAVVYPNPVEDVLKINMMSSESMSIFIYDVTGEQIMSEQINANDTPRLDVSNLIQGVYEVRIENEEGSFSTRFIKK